MKLTIAVQNLGHGGDSLDAHPSIPPELHGTPRLGMLIGRLKSVQADVLVLNEVCGWDEPGDTRFADFTAALDMEPVGITPSRSGYPTGFCYRPRPGQFELIEFDTDHGHAFHHGAAIAPFRVAGLEQPLTVAGAHIAPFAWRQADIEVSTLAYLASQHGDLGVCAGDFNWPPLIGRAPDYRLMKDYNRMARLHNPPSMAGPAGDLVRWALRSLRMLPRPRKTIAKTLYHSGFRDAAAEMYRRTRDRSFLDYTCPTERLDWIATSRKVTPGLTGYGLLTEPAWAADHHAVVVEIDTDLIDQNGLTPYF